LGDQIDAGSAIGQSYAHGKAMLPNSGKALQEGHKPRKSATTPRINPKRALYGLPCAKCRAYYDADQSQCPICNATERLSPEVATVNAVHDAPGHSVDYAALEAERDCFLRDLKARAHAAHMQICSAAGLR
jgi:hypothetical protein